MSNTKHDKNYERKPVVNMYVLSLQDIQRIENCTYSKALKIFKTMNVFHINSKPYVLANEYFCRDFDVKEITMYQPLGEGLDTKVVKLLPPILNAKDIAVIFDCGNKRAYEIIAIIPNSFKINEKTYVKADDFSAWINSLRNRSIRVGDYAKTKEK